MATVIDELIIKLGFDPSKIKEGIEIVAGVIEGATEEVRAFGKGLSDGLEGAATEATQASTALSEVGSKSKAAGDNLKDAGDKGEKAANQIKSGAKSAAREIDVVSKKAEAAGRSFGRMIKRAVLSLAAPILGAFAISNIIKKYMSDMEKLDELSKKRNLSLKERQERQELLREYSEKDLENYRLTKKAVEDFQKSIAMLGREFMLLAGPYLRAAAARLKTFTEWLSQNSQFVKILAGLISVFLLPALLSMAGAALAAIAPFLPLIAVIGILALLIDDLWTYMNGGESALEGLWSHLGTGKEIMEKLKSAFEDFKTTAATIWGAIQKAAEVFFSYFGDAWESLKATLESYLIAIGALIAGDFETFGTMMKNTFLGVGETIKNILIGAFNAIWDAAVAIFSKIANYIADRLNSALSSIPGLEKVRGFFQSNANGNAYNASGRDGVTLSGDMLKNILPETFQSMGANADLAMRGVASGTMFAGPQTIDQSTNTEMGGVNITVNTPAPDGATVGAAVRNEVAKLVSNTNHGTANP